MNIINEIILNFDSCFSPAMFPWFVAVIIGFMIRQDQLGFSSFVRCLFLDEKHYHGLNYFFKRADWNLDEVKQVWIRTVFRHTCIFIHNGAVILLGDHTKQSKEGRRMPGVKKLHQESDNSGKAEYIDGHQWGSIGILVGNEHKKFSLPLDISIQDGLKTVFRWTENEKRQSSQIVQVIYQAVDVVATARQKALLLLDRAFLSVPALEALIAHNDRSEFSLHIVTKAKSNCVAYEAPPPKTSGRGRPRLKGDAVKLKELFESESLDFRSKETWLYGKKRNVRYASVDLLWGQKLYKKLRFVLAEYDGTRTILVTTDLELTGAAVIELYSQRFKIECMFKELKQRVGAFSYHFWTKSMEKLRRFRKKDDPDIFDEITCESKRKSIIETINATERFAMLGCIALGILQILSLRIGGFEEGKKIRYLRTISNEYPSEGTMMVYVRNQINLRLGKPSRFRIMDILNGKVDAGFLEDLPHYEQAS
jgi:hypothetical protein